MRRYIYRYKYLANMAGIAGVIGEGTIKFTNPREFNDPFDCMPSSKAGAFKGMKEKNPRLYDATLGGIENPAQRLVAINRMHGMMRHKVISGEFLDLLISDASVLSLSRIPDSILMWSHYADFHRGVVVEFKIPVDINYSTTQEAQYNLMALDVVYSKERPVFEVGVSPADPDTIVNTLFLAKSDVWSYEGESRVLRNRGGGGILPYNKKLLSSVIVGPKSNYLKEVLSLSKKASSAIGHNIDVFKADFCKKEYAVKIPKFRFKKDT